MIGNQHEQQHINAATVTRVVSEFYPDMTYGAVPILSQQVAMSELSSFDEKLLQEVPGIESSLLDYRQRNEMC